MSAPDAAKTHALRRDSVTSQGAAESADATVAPRPSSTSSEGSAQQSSVPSEEKRPR